jgi:hypothetical protein
MPKTKLLSRNFAAKCRNFALNNSGGAAKADFCQPYCWHSEQNLCRYDIQNTVCFQFFTTLELDVCGSALSDANADAGGDHSEYCA